MPGVNLIPEHVVEVRRTSERRRIWGLSALLAWLLVLIPVVREQQAKGQLEHQWSIMDQIAARLSDSRQHAQDSALLLKTLHEELELAQGLRHKRAWSELIAQVVLVLPDEVWFTALSTEKPQAKAETSAVKGPGDVPELPKTTPGREGPRRLIMQGQALHLEYLYAFVEELEVLDIFESVTVGGVLDGAVGGVKVTSFSLECTW